MGKLYLLHNISQRRQRRAKPRPKVTCTKVGEDLASSCGDMLAVVQPDPCGGVSQQVAVHACHQCSVTDCMPLTWHRYTPAWHSDCSPNVSAPVSTSPEVESARKLISVSRAGTCGHLWAVVVTLTLVRSKDQTPLHRFVVDLLRTCCIQFVVGMSKYCGFVVDL